MADIFTIDHRIAFDNAIGNNLLSSVASAKNYAGNYMYMGSKNDSLGGWPVDLFKNIQTRKYIESHRPGFGVVICAEAQGHDNV